MTKKNKMKKKKIVGPIIAFIVIACLGVGAFFATTKLVGSRYTGDDNTSGKEKKQETTVTEGEEGMLEGLSRPSLIDMSAISLDEDNIVPCVPSYTLESDLSNVDNIDRFYFGEATTAQIAKDGFAVVDYGGDEFFEQYENNRYSQMPSFVTVDSLMHTYHLYFAALLKNAEKNYLRDDLLALSNDMLEASREQYEELEGTEWEEAAKRNVAFFSVGAFLLDDNTEIESYVADTVDIEIDRIYAAAGIEESTLTGGFEDYTQYIPRGYYEGDPDMESYFRAMMWYGRTAFAQDKESLDRSALLMTMALSSNTEKWEEIYAVTSFFAGASDDLGYCEYVPVIKEVYGDEVTLKDITSDESKFEEFHELTGKLDPPQICSIPVYEDEENVIPSYRFMGQRFTIDADVMQQLVYRSVTENSKGEKRMLPDVLDVAAALGSDRALEILDEQGDTDYGKYTENMAKIREEYASAPKEVWYASLYSQWLYTLNPLLEEKGDGYPEFMKTKGWRTRQLECFAGSYTELKHDTILYSKQVMAEMGGGDEEVLDDRGYVEPEVEVYKRFIFLASQTKSGLDRYGMLSDEAGEDLDLLIEIATKLKDISVKELQYQSLTDDEYEFIRSYGGNIEHFWKNATIVITGDESPSASLYPCPIVADIATDPNGSVLEVATGRTDCIIVAVPMEGGIRLCKGAVYSFYQFDWPMSDRLTDTTWKQLIGAEMLDDGTYNYERIGAPDKPAWTESYRTTWW